MLQDPRNRSPPRCHRAACSSPRCANRSPVRANRRISFAPEDPSPATNHPLAAATERYATGDIPTLTRAMAIATETSDNIDVNYQPSILGCYTSESGERLLLLAWGKHQVWVPAPDTTSTPATLAARITQPVFMRIWNSVVGAKVVTTAAADFVADYPTDLWLIFDPAKATLYNLSPESVSFANTIDLRPVVQPGNIDGNWLFSHAKICSDGVKDITTGFNTAVTNNLITRADADRAFEYYTRIVEDSFNPQQLRQRGFFPMHIYRTEDRKHLVSGGFSLGVDDSELSFLQPFYLGHTAQPPLPTCETFLEPWHPRSLEFPATALIAAVNWGHDLRVAGLLARCYDNSLAYEVVIAGWRSRPPGGILVNVPSGSTFASAAAPTLAALGFTGKVHEYAIPTATLAYYGFMDLARARPDFEPSMLPRSATGPSMGPPKAVYKAGCKRPASTQGNQAHHSKFPRTSEPMEVN